MWIGKMNGFKITVLRQIMSYPNLLLLLRENTANRDICKQQRFHSYNCGVDEVRARVVSEFCGWGGMCSATDEDPGLCILQRVWFAASLHVKWEEGPKG